MFSVSHIRLLIFVLYLYLSRQVFGYENIFALASGSGDVTTASGNKGGINLALTLGGVAGTDASITASPLSEGATIQSSLLPSDTLQSEIATTTSTPPASSSSEGSITSRPTEESFQPIAATAPPIKSYASSSESDGVSTSEEKSRTWQPSSNTSPPTFASIPIPVDAGTSRSFATWRPFSAETATALGPSSGIQAGNGRHTLLGSSAPTGQAPALTSGTAYPLPMSSCRASGGPSASAGLTGGGDVTNGSWAFSSNGWTITPKPSSTATSRVQVVHTKSSTHTVIQVGPSTTSLDSNFGSTTAQQAHGGAQGHSVSSTKGAGATAGTGTGATAGASLSPFTGTATMHNQVPVWTFLLLSFSPVLIALII